MDRLQYQVGCIGENYAAEFLQNSGFTIARRNFRIAGGEIDLIAEKEDKIVFCEVKTRLGSPKTPPHEAVDRKKLYHLHRCARYYLLQNPAPHAKLSIYVIAVLLNDDYGLKQIKCYSDVDLDY